MFTALVLVCNLDAVAPNWCYTSVSNVIFETKDECVRSVITAFDSNNWYTKREDGVEINMVAYECVEWEPGKNI